MHGVNSLPIQIIDQRFLVHVALSLIVAHERHNNLVRMHDSVIPVARDAVQDRKRCLLYLLFEYILPHRGVWTDQEAQKAALGTFLDSASLPPRTTKLRGRPIEAGPHTINTLWEAVRTGIQQHPRSTRVARAPVQSFFEYGHEAVDWAYYQDVVKAFELHNPQQVVHNRWPDKITQACVPMTGLNGTRGKHAK